MTDSQVAAEKRDTQDAPKLVLRVRRDVPGIRTLKAREQVLQSLGHPSESRPLSWQRRTLWSYRYDAPFCTWFQVGLDERGRVVDTGYGPDPLCEDTQFNGSP